MYTKKLTFRADCKSALTVSFLVKTEYTLHQAYVESALRFVVLVLVAAQIGDSHFLVVRQSDFNPRQPGEEFLHVAVETSKRRLTVLQLTVQRLQPMTITGSASSQWRRQREKVNRPRNLKFLLKQILWTQKKIKFVAIF